MAEYMCAHLGERHVGIISGATPRGIFVKLPNNAEGFVSLNDFPDCDFEFDGEITHMDRRSGLTLTVGEEPVSYTHLDVYKRQPPYCLAARI